jgi:hypothetical protein
MKPQLVMPNIYIISALVDSSVQPGDVHNLPSGGGVLNFNMGVSDLGSDTAKVDIRWWK